jgi:hypothetical protein
MHAQCVSITDPLCSELRECIHNNTQNDVQANYCHQDENGDVKY